MKRLTTIFAALCVCVSTVSGCATNGPGILPPNDTEGGETYSIRDAIIDAVLLVHPEMTRDEAAQYASEFYLDHQDEIDERRTQVTSAIALIEFLRTLLQAYGIGEAAPQE